MSTTLRRHRWAAPALATGSVIALGALAWSWASKSNSKEDSASRTRRAVKPVLCISFAFDDAWSEQLKHAPEIIDNLLCSLESKFNVYVIVHAPDGVSPPLNSERILLYSKAQGRAMLARALLPQCHVECVFTEKHGKVAWDVNDDMTAYLARLNQLAQVVDKMVVVVIPCASAKVSSSPIMLADLQRAFKKHAISKQTCIQWLYTSSWDAWDDVKRLLDDLREQTWI